MKPTLDRNTIDSIISLADFGNYNFICNDGAEYSGSVANVALYLTPSDADEDSECHDLEVKIIDGKLSIQCEVITNIADIEQAINKKNERQQS